MINKLTVNLAHNNCDNKILISNDYSINHGFSFHLFLDTLFSHFHTYYHKFLVVFFYFYISPSTQNLLYYKWKTFFLNVKKKKRKFFFLIRHSSVLIHFMNLWNALHQIKQRKKKKKNTQQIYRIRVDRKT